LRQKASAARAPTLKPVAAAPFAVDSGPATAQSLGQQLRELLLTRRLQSVSLYDREANVLWLSEGALGPDEHSVVVEALEALSADTSLQCHEIPLEDGRLALFLPVRAPHGELLGIAMILADGKSVGDDTYERVTGAPVRAIMLRLAVLLKPANSQPAGPAASEAPISPEQVDGILELSPDDALAATAAHVRPPQAAIWGLAPARDASEMVRLEFMPEPPAAPASAARPAPSPAAAAPPAGVETSPLSAPAAAAAPAGIAASAAAAPAGTAASAAAATTTTGAFAASASDHNLLLEVVPFAKLRAGGQTRRFQVLARMSPAPRDPAVQDTLVLQRLMTWLATHRAAWNSQPTGFTVAVSMATLEDERFGQKIAAALNSHGIAAETLGFEIPEAVCTQRRAQVERFLSQCEKIGTWVVIDGFTFDSQMMPLLRSKALRLVKIDPKLTSAALKDKLSQATVVATVQAAKVLGIHCAALKVDSQASLQWLTAIGCDFAQGAVLPRAQLLDSPNSLPETTAVTAHLRSG
jgi:EAL domain-containing protein (putative c-di-GMP-specific phosphodiesterase class I)